MRLNFAPFVSGGYPGTVLASIFRALISGCFLTLTDCLFGLDYLRFADAFSGAVALWSPRARSAGSVPGTMDMRGHRIGGLPRVPGFQALKYGEVFPHRGNHKSFIEPRLFLSEDPKLEQVHPIRRGNERVVEKVDQGVVQFPIHILGLSDQLRADVAFA